MKKTHNIKAVIFDLDWTLIRSTIDFSKLWSVADRWFRSRKVCILKTEKTGIDGALREGINRLKAVELLESKLTSDLKELYELLVQVELERVENTTPIEGVLELLTEMKAQGIKIAVLTNGFKEHAEEAMQVSGLTKYVDFLIAREQVDRPPKEDPDTFKRLAKDMKVKTSEVLMVGDSPVDAVFAKSVGVNFIGVATSKRQDVLRELGCKNIIPSVASLNLFLYTT